MNKRYLLLLFCFFVAAIAHGQYTRHVVEFTDKQGSIFSLANPSAFLSQKAIERRNRYKIGFDSTDIPVNPAYLDSIASIAGVRILSVSKWLNQAAVELTDPAAADKINAFPFVRKTMPVASSNKSSKKNIISTHAYAAEPQPEAPDSAHAVAINYGATFNQVHMHQGEYLHNLGFTGSGVTIAVLDGGFFRYKSNPAFDSLRLQNRLLGEWDFVASEASVNEDADHGMYCLSVLAANRPGFLVGTAPRASYYLFRTEDVSSEYPIEEQYWAAAAERADSLGVDMISSSLGYADFDNSELNHSYADRNGNTTIITRAADLAAKKGMLVMNSAGNSGNANNDLKYVAAPADGDSVVSVGAIDINNNVASFSSWGPNGNGRLKPDFVSLGVGTTVSDYNGNPATNNGTSFANPNLAGLMACLWQAFPEFNNMEIVDAVRRSASKYENPDVRFGYGIPDFKKASELLTQLRVVRNQSSLATNEWMKVFPIPYQPATSVLFRAPSTGKASLRLLDASGKILEVKSVDVTENNMYTFQFDNLRHLSRGIYLVQYHDGQNRKTIPIIR